MAHDFDIERHNERYTFFGYAEGRLYNVFDAKVHNMGVSGDGVDIEVIKSEFYENLVEFCEWIKENYPDPNRANDLKRFLNDSKNDPDDMVYIANFS